MNVSYEWLRAFVPFDESATALRDLITGHIATVDEVVSLREDLAAIVVARVIEEAPHPDSDHLHVTKVDAGTGTLLDVVCGAPNVTAGKFYPFAMTGTVLPGGLKIQKRKIRGAISDGMLCSARELGLGEEQDGILELNVDVPPGTPFLKALPIGDMKLVVDVGANRPDLLSHLGIARELSAITKKPMKLPHISDFLAPVPRPATGDFSGRAGPVDVRVMNERLVRRFMGVVIQGVTVGPSPEWLVRRLQSVGSRSINNVVDASNYVLHELGQPTHAFDLSKLGGSSVVVRRAKPGERITTLDGAEHTLRDTMVVIADAERAQAIAGIMGGRDSEVTDSTTDIFLEVANFDPTRIRNARRALGVSTDASYRFERGVDLEVAPRALERVTQLILMLAGGSTSGPPVDLAHDPPQRRTIALRPTRVARLLGETVDTSEIISHLESVGFAVSPTGEKLNVVAPSWRADVTAEVDLIEEVARLRGYDSFSVELRPARPGSVGDDENWITSKRVREFLVGAGLLEVRPMPFVAGGDGFVRLTNPLSENEAYLRREILDTLSRRAEYNLSRMNGDIRVFEIGSVFAPSGEETPSEELRVAALLMGRRTPPHFSDPKSPEFDAWVTYDVWDAKALAEEVAAISHPGATIELVQGDGESLWSILVNGSARGSVRRLVLDAPVWAAPAFGVELTLAPLDARPVAPAGENAHRPFGRATIPVTRYTPLPTTPASEFDLALLVPDSVRGADVEAVMRRVSGKLLENVRLFDRYVGSGVEPGHRSLAWRLTFRHAERTLRDREIDARRSDILRALADELNVRQRSS
jgi:phenylalanyl-tRNA synthetase beta chain